LQASLDYLLKAANAEQDTDKTESLLDLLSIFRDYTKTGKIDYSKSILATQVKALENTSRVLQTNVRKLGTPPPIITPTLPSQNPTHRNPQSYASAATRNLPSDQTGFNLVTNRKKPGTTSPPAPKPTLKEHQISFPNPGLDKFFGLLDTRTRLNKAFETAGYRGKTVISGVRLSQNNNIVITGNHGFPASFLLDKIDIIRKIFPQCQAKTNET
ncbi:uncharacterized protein K452DRAFT_345027, partial [Aplosporella prunicola CBS 121167]